MKKFITVFVLLLWGVISAQTFNNPEPSTHDVRDIFVGFQVQSSVTNTKVTLKLSQASVIHNEVIFNFPDFSFLLSHAQGLCPVYPINKALPYVFCHNLMAI
jgi:hypothetical protein